MKRWALPLALLAVLLTSVPAWADDCRRWVHDRDHSSDNWDSGKPRWDDSSDSSSDGTAGDDPIVIPTGNASSITAELTGYSWQDNTPAGSAEICCKVLHSVAAGTGTYADPITTAVPGSGSGMEFKAGTRFYVAKLRRYVIVEDSGATKMSSPHLDIWVGGQNHSRGDSDACMNSFTGRATVIVNPQAGLPVTAGELTTTNGCKI